MILVSPGTNEFSGRRLVLGFAEHLEHIEEKPVFPNIEPSTLTQLSAEPLPQDPHSKHSSLA